MATPETSSIFCRAGWLISWLLALLLGTVPRAQAHPDLDEAKRLMTELEFDAALSAFQRAVDSRGLTRDELVELLAERALLLHALHREPELLRDFVWLAALSPEHILDPRAPPELVAVWTSVRDQGRGALGLTLAHEPLGQTLRLRAELTGTVPDDVRTRIGVRAPDGSWEVVEGKERILEGRDELEVYAEALGIGGLLVARAGSQEVPLRIATGQGADNSSFLGDSRRDGDKRRRRRAWWIGSSAAVALAAATLTGVLIARANRSDDSDRTTVTPMVEF